MLTITTDDKKITVDSTVNGVEAFALNSLAFAVFEDGVTLYTAANRARVVAAPIRETSVNGTTLTADTAVSVLSALMTKVGGSGGGTGDQVQSDYTERDTSAVSYIKNKPYTELPEGTALPTNAHAGDIVVYMDESGSPVSSFMFDGFAWVQNSADYNLIFTRDTSYAEEPYIFNYELKKDDGANYFIKMLPGFSETSLVVNSITKFDKSYSLSSVNVIVKDDDETKTFEHINTRSLTLTPGTQVGEAVNTNIIIRDVEVYYMQNHAQPDSFTLEQVKPFIDPEGVERRPGISITTPRAAFNDINRPVNISVANRRVPQGVTESTFDVTMSGVAGAPTSQTGERGTEIHLTNSLSGVSVTATASIAGSFETLRIEGFGGSYTGSSLNLTLDITNYAMIYNVYLNGVDMKTEVLDSLFDAIIAEGTPRDPNITSAYIGLYEVTGYTLSDERRVALEALNFSISI